MDRIKRYLLNIMTTPRAYQVTYLDSRAIKHSFEILANDVRHAILSAHELYPTVRITRVVQAEEWQ